MTIKQTLSDAIDPRFFDQVAQIAHTFTTYGISFTLATRWGWRGYAIGAVGCFIYAVIHEFVWDPRMENAATRGSDLQDFAFLCLGIGLAGLMHFWMR